jgi:hypothetical protein
MGIILAQLQSMSEPGYFEDTPSNIKRNLDYYSSGLPDKYGEDSPKEGERAPRFKDLFEGMEAQEIKDYLEMYGEADSGGITTDKGEESNITISGSKEARYKKDLLRIKEGLKKAGEGAPVPVEPIQGRLPGLISSQGNPNYRPVQEPYQYGVPSVLNSQAEIQNKVINDLTSALGKTILKRRDINFLTLI